MNKLNASYLYTVSSRGNVRQESSRSTPTKTSTVSPSYFSQGWDTLLLDDSFHWEISSGTPRWVELSLNERLHPTPAMSLDLVSKSFGFETQALMEDVSQYFSLTTEKNGDERLEVSTNPGVTMTSTTCSSLSGGVSGSPIVSRGSLPTAWTHSISGQIRAVTDSLIQKCKAHGLSKGDPDKCDIVYGKRL